MACLTRSSRKLELAFDRIESKGGCASADSSPLVRSQRIVLAEYQVLISEVVYHIASEVSCPDKLKAAGQNVVHQFLCHAGAIRKDELVGSGAASSAGCFVVADVLGYTPGNHEDLNVCDGTSAAYGIGCYYRGDSLNWARATSPVTTCAATGNIAGVCESNKLRICACD